MHRLLARQLRRLGLSADAPPDAKSWTALIERIEASYDQSDQDRYLLERSLEISSKEMRELYDQLKSASESEIAQERGKLAAVFASIGDGLCTLDTEGRIETSNPASVRLLGLSAEELRGMPVTDFIEQKECWPTLERNPDSTAVEGIRQDACQMQKADGSSFPASFVLDPMESGDQLLGWVLVFRDVTDRMQVEEDLRVAKDSAERSSEAKSAFLATMSHEIRTPMNGLLGMLTLLERTELTAGQQEYIRVAQASANALLTIIDDILDFSKIEGDHIELESTEFDLHTGLATWIRSFVGMATEKGLDLNLRIAPSVPSRVVGDPGRMRQVISNLVVNALKFTESGEVLVEIENNESNESHQANLELRIMDTGIGIPADRAGKVFQPFAQVDASTTRNYGGTGLGLSISQQLIHRMGGTIDFESEPGIGTTFTCRVPFGIPADGASARSESPAGAERDQGKIVWWIESRSRSRAIIEELFESHGAIVHSFRDREDLLEALEEVPARATPDLALVGTPCGVPEALSVVRLIKTRLPDSVPIEILASVTAPVESTTLTEHGVTRLRTLPLIPGDRLFDPPQIVESSKCSLMAGSGPQECSLRILVAEDNPINVLVITELLTSLGHASTVAANGLIACDLARSTEFDLVLMDCQMPELDGLEAARQIRAFEREESRSPLKIIALTANALQGDREACLAAGMDGYLTKPIQPSALSRELAKVRSPEARILTEHSS